MHRFEALIPRERVRSCIEHWIIEDCPTFDVAGAVVEAATLRDDRRQALITCKTAGAVICGLWLAQEIFTSKCLVEEGSEIAQAGTDIMLVLGPPSEILRGERIALNLMARLSAIATTTRRVRRRLVETSDSWCGRVAGTRKTTPGFRLFEKYALLVGGADAHRHDLSASIMLKDNHIVAFGSIRGAVQAVKTLASFTQSLEVECRNQEEALEAAEAGADIVMLDNFSARTARETARLLKDRLPHIKIEVSGGIGEENVASYSDPAIDVISMGCLTLGPHQVIDLSLNLQPSECHLKASE